MAWFCTSEEPKEGDGGPRAADPGGQLTRHGIVIVDAEDAVVEARDDNQLQV